MLNTRLWLSLLAAVAFCLVVVMFLLALSAQKTRGKTQALIAEADRQIMAQFGLTDYRVQFSYTSQSSSLFIAKVSAFLKRRLADGVPGTRIEEHSFSSGVKRMRTRLHIERERLQKAEIAATPDCRGAAREWAKKVKTAFPHIVIVINGQREGVSPEF